MEVNDVTSDIIIAELLGMGFDLSDITEAVKAVGPSLGNAIEFIVNDSRRISGNSSTSAVCHSTSKVLGKRSTSSLQPSSNMRQQNITEYSKVASGPQRNKTRALCKTPFSQTTSLTGHVQGSEVSSIVNTSLNHCQEMLMVPPYWKDEQVTGFDWERKADNLLKKHFGYSSLKDFQKKVVSAWLANQDCLVLAATGSGKSLCFQIPALLSGKVVVVISPLISLMHDQCLKLGKHGISACFLGSGQIDKIVETKAMCGAYNIIYACPETILRLLEPLQGLKESRGIALFAIDEVHCVSKWGHDFRRDYRRLSVLRENFSNIPLMALTATATIRVRQDILKSLCMSAETKTVITSFFRPNLRFSVKHSNTSSSSSYEEDFSELVELYTKKKKSVQNCTSRELKSFSEYLSSTSSGSTFGVVEICKNKVDDIDEDDFSDGDRFSGEDEIDLLMGDRLVSADEKELSIQFLEDDYDNVQEVDDLDVSCGAFCGESPINFNNYGTPDSPSLPIREESFYQRLEEGSTIIYVPTRKETLSVAKFFSRFGVKAAAYNAKLPKSHLRQVHKEFHEDTLQVVVATVAFGMGIDKSNVRRIIHYGWPQSLEAYYQEAGRAGRDGKLADCVLYANLSRIPTLLPSKRSEEQAKQAYKMLSDCFRYGMETSLCRAKILVEYFGEDFTRKRCLVCDVCINGPPEIQNLKDEAKTLLQLIVKHYVENNSCEDAIHTDNPIRNINLNHYHMVLKEKPNIRTLVSWIREQNLTFATSDLIWWRGLARILEDRGFIREGTDMNRVQIQFPEPTDSGLQFLMSELEQPFNVYPEADMLLSMKSDKSFSGFSEWGKGWADPEIRGERLKRKKTWRKPSKRKSRKRRGDWSTVRGRLSAKLSK